MSVVQSPVPQSELPQFLAGTAGEVLWLYQPPSLTPLTVTGAFAELFGRALPADAKVSHRWKAWIHPEDQSTVTQAFETGLANGSFRQVYRLLLPDGGTRWIHDRAVPLGALGIIRITSDFSHHWRQQMELAGARSRAELLAELGAEMSLVLEPGGMVREASPSYLAMVGQLREDTVGKNILDAVEPGAREAARAELARVAREPRGRIDVQWPVQNGAGAWLWLEGSLRNHLTEPHVAGLVANLRDVTVRNQAHLERLAQTEQLADRFRQQSQELKIATERVRELERLQRKVLLALPDVMIRCTGDSTVLDITGPVQQMVAPPAQIVGTRFVDRPELTDAVRSLWMQALHRALESGRNQICEYPISVLAGQREFEARFTPIGPDEVAVMIRDVAERNRLRDRVQHVAMHDELTGLLNRNALRDQLDELFLRAPRSTVALLVIDLDRFKQVNDTFGHAIGDTLLKVVANRITRRGGADSLRARLGGDEFALAIDCSDAPDVRGFVESMAQSVITELGNRMRLHGESLYLTPSIGIALYPADASDADTLIRNADVAMMRTKELGRNSYQFYDPAITAQASSLFNTEQSLRRALDEGQIGCLFQPKIRVKDGSITGVEALVRWNAPDGQVLSPARFIPLAEKTGLIKPLGRWVLHEAMRQIAQLPALGRPLIDLAVNVSVAQLRDNTFLHEVRNALAQCGYPPARLTLEIAETAFVDDMQLTADALAELAHAGVRISIDDFGTGYGGLSWLKNLPVQEIKIDRSFIKGCAIDAFDATIVSGLIEIAHNLGIQTVAEGVERADQIAFLTQVKCDVIQGYFIGMPMGVDELVKTARLWQPGRT